MRFASLALLVSILFGSAAPAQSPVTNEPLRSYNVNGVAALAANLQSPIEVVVHTDCPFTMNVQANQSSTGYPVVMLYDAAGTLGNSIQIAAFMNFGVQLDLRDKNNNGYADQILFDGFAKPSPFTWTDAVGQLSLSLSLPACTNHAGLTSCIAGSNFDQFEVSSQALVLSPTSPLSLRSTAAVRGTFTNGYREWTPGSVGSNGSAVFSFQQGFSFKFYGTTYTQAFLSENGFVSFGTTSVTAFPSATLANMRSGPPRIMSLFTDLVLAAPTANSPTKMSAQQYCENGLRKVRFVHQRLQEFGNSTGPHGGEIVITENGDIAVYVASYQTSTSIATGVGITPGNSTSPALTGFGRDLSALAGSNFILGAGAAAYELFDAASVPQLNPLDLAGFGNTTLNAVGRGVVFLQDANLSNTTATNSGYIIQ